MKNVKQFFSDIRTSWKTLWSSKPFRAHCILTFLIFAVVVHYCTLNISIWEARKGTLLLDPLLHHLTPRNFSMPIFIIVFGSMFFSIFLDLATPKELLKAFQAYSLLLVMRTLSIYLVPLEPPMGMIFLKDPVSGFFLNNVHVVTKDLFFSGHISTMFLFIYFSPNKYWRRCLMMVTPLLAGMILWQHVHYTVDIAAAPFFAWIGCKLVDLLNERWEYGMDKIPQHRWQYQS